MSKKKMGRRRRRGSQREVVYPFIEEGLESGGLIEIGCARHELVVLFDLVNDLQRLQLTVAHLKSDL